MKKCVNGQYLEMTPEEIAALEQAAAQRPTLEPTSEERITALEEELAAERKNREFLEDCIAEMATQVYGGDS